MGSVHESAAQKMFNELMETPDGALTYQIVHAGLRDGRWSERYMDAIGQHGVRSRTSWPQNQVAAFGFVHLSVVRGEVALVPVSTLGTPRRDSCREENAAALANLPHPFVAEVDADQNCGDCDGIIKWTEPIEVTVCSGLSERTDSGVLLPVPLHVMIQPGEAPLEIGSSLPSRTWLHLREDRAVARWPYGHDSFMLFVKVTCIEEELGRRFAA
jgi:hypothetical protein